MSLPYTYDIVSTPNSAMSLPYTYDDCIVHLTRKEVPERHADGAFVGRPGDEQVGAPGELLPRRAEAVHGPRHDVIGPGIRSNTWQQQEEAVRAA